MEVAESEVLLVTYLFLKTIKKGGLVNFRQRMKGAARKTQDRLNQLPRVKEADSCPELIDVIEVPIGIAHIVVFIFNSSIFSIKAG